MEIFEKDVNDTIDICRKKLELLIVNMTNQVVGNIHYGQGVYSNNMDSTILDYIDAMARDGFSNTVIKHAISILKGIASEIKEQMEKHVNVFSVK